VSKTVRITICALPFVVAALIVAASLPDPVKYQLAPLVRNIASGLFLTAGVLRLVAWRLTGDWASARSAIALLTVGTSLLWTSVLRLLVHDGHVVDLEAPETRLLYALPIVCLAIVGARHSQCQMRRTILALVTTTLAVVATLSMVATTAPADESHVALWIGIEAICAAAWAALALQAWGQRSFSARSTPRWAAFGLLLMAGAELLKAWSVADAHAPHGIAGFVQIGAAAVAVTAALSGLWLSIRAEGVDSGGLTRALVDTERRLAQIEELQRRRLHDARSAVMGVVGASKLLAMPALSPTVDSALLQALVTRELDRLQGLLEIEEREPIVEFDLADALAVVVLARRLDGTVIELDCRDMRVLGRPQATATVLDNLLRNAHLHAPRSRVLVTARSVGIEVEIVVSDDGPGIPAPERARVLEAGVRGTTARGTGSGFGLYSAARAMSGQFGSLKILAGPCGGTRVVMRMPAAAVAPALAS
jgi:signal transduction histidine kinase